MTAFESCYNLKNIEVSENNKNYSDIDGILFNKDKTEILCYPQAEKIFLIQFLLELQK